jgi:hypothetical protein
MASHVDAVDESLLLQQPIVTTKPGHLRSMRTINRIRALDNLLDDETQLLEDELIELLAHSAR